MTRSEQHREVVLLSPPYSYPVSPSIALGIFRTLLDENGISSETLYPMFLLIRLAGPEMLRRMMFPPRTMIEEYLFSHLTGLKKKDDLDAYVDFVLEAWKERPFPDHHYTRSDIREWIVTMRGIAEQVVEETAREIAAINPQVLAVSSVFYQLNGALAIIRRVKELAPQIRTLMGGPNCMGGNGGAILRYCPDVDAVFFGEGDEVFAETIRALEKDRPLPYGVLRRCDLSPEMREEKDFPFRITKTMDEVPIPDYSGFFQYFNRLSPEEKQSILVDEIFDKQGQIPTIFMEGSRGCWWAAKKACTFCGLNGVKNIYRQRSSRRIFEELVLQTTRYQTPYIEFTDNAFPTQMIHELSQMKEKTPINFEGFAEVKPFLSEKDLFGLKKLGITTLQAGIETLDDHLLKLLNKGGSTAISILFLKSCEHAGIRLFWNLLVSIPGEQKADYESMLKIIPLLFHLPPPTGYTEINFERRGTYAMEAERFGLELVPLPVYQFTINNDKDMIRDFAQHYIDIGPEQERMKRETSDVCSQLIQLMFYWRAARRNSRLDMADRGDYLIVIDSRPCCKMSLCFLKGIARKICLLCVLPRPFEKILQELNAETEKVTAQDVQECLDYLIENRFIIHISGMYLTLAILRGSDEM